MVLLEPRSVLLQGGVKLLQVAVTDSCRETDRVALNCCRLPLRTAAERDGQGGVKLLQVAVTDRCRERRTRRR